MHAPRSAVGARSCPRADNSTAVFLARGHGPALCFEVWPPRHSLDTRMVLACWWGQGRTSSEADLEPGCQTSLVWRHVALERTAKRGSLWLQGLAGAIDCAEDGDPGQRKPTADSIGTHRSGLRRRAACRPRWSALSTTSLPEASPPHAATRRPRAGRRRSGSAAT